MFFGFVLLVFATLGSLAFYSIYGRIEQQQADLELTVADLNKNNAKLKVQLKKREESPDEVETAP